MTAPQLASRTMRARRAGRCHLCRGAVLVGQRIGKLTSGWAHVTCINDKNRTTA